MDGLMMLVSDDEMRLNRRETEYSFSTVLGPLLAVSTADKCGLFK
jgi:hypothetical protein